MEDRPNKPRCLFFMRILAAQKQILVSFVFWLGICSISLIACKPSPIASGKSYQSLLAEPLFLSSDSFLARFGLEKQANGKIRAAALTRLHPQESTCTSFASISSALRFLQRELHLQRKLQRKKNRTLQKTDCQKGAPWLVYVIRWEFAAPREWQNTTGLEFSQLPGSARVYLKHSYLGELGHIEEDGRPQLWLPITPAWIPVPPGSLQRKNVLALLVQNGHYARPKIGEIRLGSHYAHYRRHDLWLATAGFLFGIFLIASFFNLFFFFGTRRYAHLFAALIPGLLCLHSLPWLVLQIAYPALLHGFDTAILFAFLPACVFLFYRHLYTSVFKNKSNNVFVKKTRGFLVLYGKPYILYVGLSIAFYLCLGKIPRQYQDYLPYFFWAYDIPAGILVLLLLSMAIYEGLAAARLAFVSSTFFFASLWSDAFAISQKAFPRLGSLFYVMLLFVLQFILILALNRYRTLQESHRSRKLLKESKRKLKEAEALKDKYIIASAREFQSELQKIAQRALFLLDEHSILLSKKSLAEISEILHSCRTLQKRFFRAEFLFRELAENKLPFSPVHLTHLLDYFYLLSKSREKSLRIRIDMEPDLPMVIANRDLLLHLLEELLDNTIEHSPKARIHIHVRRMANTVELVWHDKGLARKARRLQRFLAPFQKGDEKTRGLGLGLSVVYRISELHGHPLEILPNGSLRFCFNLQEGLYQDPKRRRAILHIAFLYQARRHSQALEEILGFEKQKLSFRLLSRFKKADAINSFLQKHEDFLKLQHSYSYFGDFVSSGDADDLS